MVQNVTENLRFAARKLIVTGAGSGIGKAVTERLLQEGAKVVAVDISGDRLKTLAAELGSTELETVEADISVQAGVDDLLIAAGDPIDGLANVAGIMDDFLPLAEVDDETWDRVMAVNVGSMVRLSRGVLPGMLKRGNGAIVNVASEAGLRGSAAGVAYTASKHAVIGITKNSAFFYGPKGIRVNAIAPGPVATNIVANFKSELATGRIGPVMQATMPDISSPEQQASAITWLLSDDASYVNGVVLPVDGGWSVV